MGCPRVLLELASATFQQACGALKPSSAKFRPNP
jgi:hypothetical protein